ncbi:MAG: hypothetical protein FJZ04_02310 [Candidatus Moranbacteria bacterium]|nr:hypothetical protein [Candidatus Moranbacteria bacterium]
MKEKNKKTRCFRLNCKKAALFLFVGLIALSPIVQADSVIPNINDSGWDRSAVTAGNDQLIGLTYSLRTLLWTSGIVLESSQSVLTRVADINFYQNQLGGFFKKKETGSDKSASAKSGWNWVRNFCNLAIIIVLLFIAFGTILRVESYNYKYLLVKLIVVAALVNFSGVLTGIILDFSHIIMGIFSDQIANIGKRVEDYSKIIQEFTGNADLGSMDTVTTDLTQNMTRTISRVNVNMILASIMMFILGISTLAVALFLVVRTVSLWLLFTLSPLALALYVLPHTRAASLKWWDAFLRYAFAGPLLFFFLYLTIFIAENLNIPAEPGLAGQDRFIFFSNSGSLLDYIFLVVLLWASIFLSRSLSITGSTQVVGYFRDITRGDKSLKVINKLVDSGGAALSKTRAGKLLHQWAGAPVPVKEEIKGPWKGGEGIRAVRTFQPMLKAQTEATRKALESLLNPGAVGRVLSIVDAKRKGGDLGQLGGNLSNISQTAALSWQDPGEYVRKLWRRFEPQARPTGSFWKDARTLNEEINKQMDAQEKVQQVFNEIGTRSDRISQFQAQDTNAREAQIYKLAWTGGLPDYLNRQGKAYNPNSLSEFLTTTFGEARGARIAEKLKMIGETKKDSSLNVASWNEQRGKFEISPKAQEAVKIDPKDLKTIAPHSILNKDNRGNYTGFNEAGKQLLKEMSREHIEEIQNMREETVKAISEAYKNSQQELSKSLMKQMGRSGAGGAVQAETIKAIGQAQMHGKFRVEEMQAPHAQINLGQEFLNKIAGRAFASKQMKTGQAGVISADESRDKEVKTQELSTEAKKEHAKIAGRSFAEKQTIKEKNKLNIAEAEKATEETTGLKEKQKKLMLGNKAAEA